MDEAGALKLLAKGEVAFLGMVEDLSNGSLGGYTIPINYAWDGADHIYMHCAMEGHKLDCIDRWPNVTLSVSGATKIMPGQFTTLRESIVVRGTVERHLTEEGRHQALMMLVKKYDPEHMEEGKSVADRALAKTEILRITITHISAKAKQK